MKYTSVLIGLLFVGLGRSGGWTESRLCGAEIVVPVTWWCAGDDEEAKRNVRWRSEKIRSFFTPVVDRGRVFVGGVVRDREQAAMVSLAGEDGRLLWEADHLLFAAPALYAQSGCSKPTVDGDRAFYQTQRGELIAVDLDGLADGNDGPNRDEEAVGPTGADIVWKMDFGERFKIFMEDDVTAGDPVASPVVIDDLVIAVTGHGKPRGTADYDPKPPSLVAVDKRTGQVAWTSNAPTHVTYRQWASPVAATVAGRRVVLFPAGDGVLYAFEPRQGTLLWKVDFNEPSDVAERRRSDADENSLRGFFWTAPTVIGETAYGGLRCEPGPDRFKQWPLLAIDLKEAAAGRRVVRWKFTADDYYGTMCAVAVDGEMAYVLDSTGWLRALDRQTGRELGRVDELPICGADLTSPIIIGRHLYVGTDDGSLFVFGLGSDFPCLGCFGLEGRVCGTPVRDEGTLYVTTTRAVWALRLPPELKDDKPDK